MAFTLQHAGVAGLQVNRAVNVQALPPAGLRYRDRGVFWRPATHWPYRMRWMYRVGEQHRFIGVHVVQQVFVRLDEGGLLLSEVVPGNWTGG